MELDETAPFSRWDLDLLVSQSPHMVLNDSHEGSSGLETKAESGEMERERTTHVCDTPIRFE